MSKNIIFLSIQIVGILLVINGFFSCSVENSAIEFDSARWKSDLKGCQGKRLELRDRVEEIRLDLIGMNERAIRPLLGKPDAEELLERGNKIYIYYISPSPKCQQTTENSPLLALTLRFEPLGTVKEAMIITE